MHGQDFVDATKALRSELSIAKQTPHDGQLENAPTLIRALESWANVLNRYSRLATLFEDKATEVERAWTADSFQAAACKVNEQFGDQLFKADPSCPSTGFTRRMIAGAYAANVAEYPCHRLEPITQHKHLLDLRGAIQAELNLSPADTLREALQGLLAETDRAVSKTEDTFGDSVFFTWQLCGDRELLKRCLPASIVGPAMLPFIAAGVDWVERQASRTGVVKPFNWSQCLPPAVWLTRLQKCFGPISRTTFYDMHNGRHSMELRKHPDSTTKSLSLDLDDLSRLGYREETAVEPAATTT